PAALTTGNPSTMRASGIAVLTPLFSAAGVVLFGNLIRNTLVLRRIYYPAVVGATVLMFAAMAFRYVRSPYFQELSFQKIGVDMGRALGRHEKRYKAVFIERYVSIPYIYVAAFAPIPPREFHRIPKRLYSDGMDAFTRVGKYYFVVETIMPSVIGSMGRDPRFLFVSPKRMAGLTAVDSVSFGTQKLLFQTCGPTCRASR
ncbi:MAG TPA: hypothetical protein VM939_01560, partial [Gemmatimonadaceae bacterium]|nr:hypothetical protein [Gemmatimonadaceae bacterium]